MVLKFPISIHALHEESDGSRAARPPRGKISIHALHEESDHVPGNEIRLDEKFQSTLSMRRATHSYGRGSCVLHISIHALHEESDLIRLWRLTLTASFQSTLSMRRATQFPPFVHERSEISIHALHEESDLRHPDHILERVNFNPRSP